MIFESLTGFDIALVLAIGFMVGLAKAGIHGLTLLSVPLLALLFGGKHSSCVMLPMQWPTYLPYIILTAMLTGNFLSSSFRRHLWAS